MKIYSNPSDTPAQGYEYGLTSFASFRRIVATMVESGELILREGEYVKSITVSSQGLSFVIEKE